MIAVPRFSLSTSRGYRGVSGGGEETLVVGFRIIVGHYFASMFGVRTSRIARCGGLSLSFVGFRVV